MLSAQRNRTSFVHTYGRVREAQRTAPHLLPAWCPRHRFTLRFLMWKQLQVAIAVLPAGTAQCEQSGKSSAGGGGRAMGVDQQLVLLSVTLSCGS